MVEADEDFYYHRVPQDIPQDLFFALEGWMAFSDLMQVFDNELGLYLSRDFYVMPLDFTTEKEFNRDRQEYLNVSQRAGLKCSITHDWSLDSPLGEEFSKAVPIVAERVLKAGQHLLHRLDECDGPGHQAGLRQTHGAPRDEYLVHAVSVIFPDSSAGPSSAFPQVSWRSELFS